MINLPSLLEEIGRSTIEERRQSLQSSVFEENKDRLPNRSTFVFVA